MSELRKWVSDLFEGGELLKVMFGTEEPSMHIYNLPIEFGTAEN